MSEHNLGRMTFWLAPLLLITLGCGDSTTQTNPAPSGSTSDKMGPVTVRVVTSEQTIETVVENVVDGSTVDDVMRQISDMDIEIVGSGEMTFLNSIQGQATDQVSGWTYEIDGEYAEAGIGATHVHPPTTIEWKFGDWGESSDSP